MNKVNELVIISNNYRNEEEFWNAVKDAIRVLLEADYIIVVNYEEVGVVVINFDHADRELCAPYPYWLTDEDVDAIVLSKEEV